MWAFVALEVDKGPVPEERTDESAHTPTCPASRNPAPARGRMSPAVSASTWARELGSSVGDVRKKSGFLRCPSERFGVVRTFWRFGLAPVVDVATVSEYSYNSSPFSFLTTLKALADGRRRQAPAPTDRVAADLLRGRRWVHRPDPRLRADPREGPVASRARVRALPHSGLLQNFRCTNFQATSGRRHGFSPISRKIHH